MSVRAELLAPRATHLALLLGCGDLASVSRWCVMLALISSNA